STSCAAATATPQAIVSAARGGRPAPSSRFFLGRPPPPYAPRAGPPPPPARKKPLPRLRLRDRERQRLVRREHPRGQEARRILQLAVLVNLEVQMAAGCLHAGAADRADDVAGADRLALLDAERIQMEVAAANTVRVHDAHEEAARTHLRRHPRAAPAFEL